jgi:isopentenyl-diphosphate delta-isomerase
MQRKDDHILMSKRAQVSSLLLDDRFDYEPLFQSHPDVIGECITLGNKTINHPIWISSMTGGSERAGTINQRLAQVASHFGFGMGLGSLRPILSNEIHVKDFNIRPLLGDYPLWGNLGIAQIEEMLNHQLELDKLDDIFKRLELDGLIIHLNFLQEWFQIEGDRLKKPMIETLLRFRDRWQKPIMIKEVGHGLGPRSLKAILELDIAALELAAFGGTNFTQLENDRSKQAVTPFTFVGATKEQMLDTLNLLLAGRAHHPNIIVSGGMKNMVDGYYYLKKYPFTTAIGFAQSMIEQAILGEEQLFAYAEGLVREYAMAKSCLMLKGDN